MWRRVSCEQPLDTSQSILRLRGSLNQMFGDFTVWRETKLQPKGNPVHIPEPGSGTVFDLVNRGNTNRLRDAHRNSGKSFLFCISHRVPGILLKREWVLVWRRMKHFLFHPRAVGGTLKISVGLRRFRISSYPYPQQVSKVNSLWSIE